jgi:hypothetical protein
MIDLARLLPKMLNATGENPEMVEIVAKLAWTQAAGVGLRPHAVPFRLHQKTLIVSVRDAIWQKQLQAMGSELVFRVNRFLSREVVDFIEFCIDPATIESARAAKVPRTDPARSASSEPIPVELIDAAANISDRELRERFIRAAENCIARRELLKRGNVSAEDIERNLGSQI